MTQVTTIDPETIAQLAAEGMAIIQEYAGYTDPDTPAIFENAVRRGEPLSPIEHMRDRARDMLEDRSFNLEGGARRLRVSVAHEALASIVEYFKPGA